MRPLFLLLTISLLLPPALEGQLFIDFESGTIEGWSESTPGRWGASDSEPISGLYSMRHIYDNSEASYDVAGLPIRGLRPEEGTAVWSFRVRHGFNPSANNNWALFLVSDAPVTEMVPGGGASGFAVGVNFTGNDKILKLLRVDNGVATEVVNSGINWETSVGRDSAAHIRVERTIAGEWSLELLDEYGERITIAYGDDDYMPSVRWFGIFYRYTMTADRLLWLDNLYIDGVWYIDDTPPEIVKLAATGSNKVAVKLSEELSDGAAEADRWLLEPYGINPVEVVHESALSLTLHFDSHFTIGRDYTIRASDICDLWGNCREEMEARFTYAIARPGDIVISELMSRPNPAVGLPAYQYIELFNVSAYALTISDWTLKVNSSSVPLSGITIESGDYHILCRQDAYDELSPFGKTTALASLPSLTLRSGTIALLDSTSLLIHYVEYDEGWHSSHLKAAGGWSLEMIDAAHPFQGGRNWSSSIARSGGTPGSPNSVMAENPDIKPLHLTNVYAADPSTLYLTFNKSVMLLEQYAGELSGYGFSVESITATDLLRREFRADLSGILEVGEVYVLDMPQSVTGFCGSHVTGGDIRFALAEEALEGDLRFNEILFDPWPGEPGFIEFVNVSERAIDVSRLLFVVTNLATGSESQGYSLSPAGRILLPGEYFVVTSDVAALTERYPGAVPSRIFEPASMPVLPRERASVTLYNRELDLIDRVRYERSMHYSLLSGTTGVSLEKISPTADSYERDNWYSASGSAGWATPGAVNSQAKEEPGGGGGMTLSSARLVPGSVIDDQFVTITVRLPGRENAVTVMIFDERGGHIKTLTDNLYTGSEFSVVWDGRASDNRFVREGIYIIMVQAFDSEGKRFRFREVCAVLYR